MRLELQRRNFSTFKMIHYQSDRERLNLQRPRSPWRTRGKGRAALEKELLRRFTTQCKLFGYREEHRDRGNPHVLLRKRHNNSILPT
jgi:hypothetical protein